MAKVSLDGKTVMEGNFWDFHPGCHGLYQYGEFKGYAGLRNAILRTLYASGPNVEIEVKYEDYTWE
jgi:hypothetical protein